MTLVFFVLVVTWMMSFTRTGLPMQSNAMAVSDASAVYCQALMTASSSGTETEVGAAKPLAVTSSPRHVHSSPTSHLVTNRAYMTSKLTSDYVSETSVEKPSGMLTGSFPHAKSELESCHMHNMLHQSEDIANDDVTGNASEYVEFVRQSGSDSQSASISELETLRTDKSARLGTSSSFPASTENGDVLYWEIKDDHCQNYADISQASGYSAAAREDVVVERDKLLQRVSRLTIEKQEVVYKLREFVKTNAELHANLERSSTAIVELQNKLSELESTLETERREKASMSTALTELTSYRTSNHNEKEQLSNNGWQRTAGAVINAAEVDSAGSSPSSSGVQAELRQAVLLALEQQQQLETLRVVIEQQSRCISKLCQRDASLGLELRQASVQDMHAPSDDSRTTSAHVAAAVAAPAASAMAAVTPAAGGAEPVKDQSETDAVPLTANTMLTAVHTQRLPSSSSRHAVFDVFSSTRPPSPGNPTTQRSPPPAHHVNTPPGRQVSHTASSGPLVNPSAKWSPPPPPACQIKTPASRPVSHSAPSRQLVSPSTQQSPPPPTCHIETSSRPMPHTAPSRPLVNPSTQQSPPPPIRHTETPASRPMSHTAPARPLVRPEPELAAAAIAKQSHLESLPSGFEMTTACPICQMPIPFDATSSDVFARHVDECISRVTREGPGPTSSPRDTVSVDRTCPVCNMVCLPDKFSQSEFERHVNDHFDDVASQFVQLL